MQLPVSRSKLDVDAIVHNTLSAHVVQATTNIRKCAVYELDKEGLTVQTQVRKMRNFVHLAVCELRK